MRTSGPRVSSMMRRSSERVPSRTERKAYGLRSPSDKSDLPRCDQRWFDRPDALANGGQKVRDKGLAGDIDNVHALVVPEVDDHVHETSCARFVKLNRIGLVLSFAALDGGLEDRPKVPVREAVAEEEDGGCFELALDVILKPVFLA